MKIAKKICKNGWLSVNSPWLMAESPVKRGTSLKDSKQTVDYNADILRFSIEKAKPGSNTTFATLAF